MMVMQWYQWMALAALGFCVTACLMHFIRLLSIGKPVDFSRPAAAKTGSAIRYAFTGAMSPAKKESAFLHLPTYSAGLLYHMGTFLSLLLFFFIISDLMPRGWLATTLAAFLCISAISGFGILVKRIVKKELSSLSNPDDFISNFLVTIFQLMTIVVISPLLLVPSSPFPAVLPSYYLIFTLLMLYIPVGKLRHTVYFFAARYHLGYFFGWRGVWPPGKAQN
jgi:predicted neutral ceramidase superfamily lipid hydrolase